jgi:hypothetical protein
VEEAHDAWGPGRLLEVLGPPAPSEAGVAHEPTRGGGPSVMQLVVED